jgi:hypothetical protein
VGGDGGSKPVGSSEKNTMAGENMMRADVLLCENHREALENHQRQRALTQVLGAQLEWKQLSLETV